VSYSCIDDWTQEDASAFDRQMRAMAERSAPWAWLHREVAIAERTLKAIEDGEPGSDDPDIFKPHGGAGWYSREILKRADWLRAAGERGDPEQQCRMACELGYLVATINLKNVGDDAYEAGRRWQEVRENVNEGARSATHSHRRAIVEGIMAERRCGAREAIKIAAQRHAGQRGFSAASFKASYYEKPV
jgi:hypothetical protein